MSDKEELPPLSMAPQETPPESMAREVDRQSRNNQYNHELNLSQSLRNYRVGSVGYLNAVPLTRGLEDEVQFATPSELADLLRNDKLDAALVSVTEVLLQDRYDVVDGIAVASLGEVKSVLLAHRGPLSEAREIYCDAASLTSVNLLKVLLAEQGFKPAFKRLEGYPLDALPDYTLLIGDPAIEYLRGPGKDQPVLDLGSAWHELTGLPFVYAVWALRRDIDPAPLIRELRSARAFGLDTLDHIIRSRNEFDEAFRRDYLGWHIHYHLGPDEKAGLQRFGELLEKHGLGPVHDLRFRR